MTAEAEAEPQPVEIRTCAPPELLALRFVVGEEEWLLRPRAARDRRRDRADPGADVRRPRRRGRYRPGLREYYLDRLVAAETGGNPEAVDFFADYHPAMQPYYADLADRLFPPSG